MSKKKKIIFAVITVLIMIIISFIVPVKRERGYKYGNGDFDISNHETFDYTIYTYKNIYGMTLKTEYLQGIEIIN